MKTVVRNFVPVFIGRGVVQISGYVDAWLASWLGTGALSAFSYAQILFTLPVSLFGMSVSAAELPHMSGAIGSDEEVAAALRARLDPGLRQIAFFVLPSVVAFLVLGDVIVAAVYQTGRFTRGDAIYVWGILAGATVGLLASTLGRLYSSAYYALRDTRTPLRFAIVRVVADDHSRLSVRDSAAAAARDRNALGRGRADSFGRHRLLGGIRIAAADAESPDRPHRNFTGLSREALGGGHCRRGGRMGDPPFLRPSLADSRLRCLVLVPYGIVYFGMAVLLGISEARNPSSCACTDVNCARMQIAA